MQSYSRSYARAARVRTKRAQHPPCCDLKLCAPIFYHMRGHARHARSYAQSYARAVLGRIRHAQRPWAAVLSYARTFFSICAVIPEVMRRVMREVMRDQFGAEADMRGSPGCDFTLCVFFISHVDGHARFFDFL